MDAFEDFWEELEASGFLRDTLTVERLTPAPLNEHGKPTGNGLSVVLIDQPCSDQDVNFSTRVLALVNGVPGALPVSKCYTAWFEWPDAEGGELIVRVNDRARPLMKQGPPVDVGAMGQVYVLELGPPSGR